MTTQPTLEHVSKELTAWRGSRAKRGPIPLNLQKKIANLRPHYLDNQIVKALGLNTEQLKRFSQKVQAKKGPSEPTVEFARVTPSIPTGTSHKITCHIKRPNGNALQCLISPSELTSLVQVFLCSH